MINNPIFLKKDRSYSSFLCRAYPELFSTNGVPMNSSANKCKTITF
jgi:hypothetical protein